DLHCNLHWLGVETYWYTLCQLSTVQWRRDVFLSVSNTDCFSISLGDRPVCPGPSIRILRGEICQTKRPKEKRAHPEVSALRGERTASGLRRLPGDDRLAPGLQHRDRQQRGQDVGACGNP